MSFEEAKKTPSYRERLERVERAVFDAGLKDARYVGLESVIKKALDDIDTLKKAVTDLQERS